MMEQNVEFSDSVVNIACTPRNRANLRRLKTTSIQSFQRWEKENELLYAMIEDESTWLSTLFPDIFINADLFFYALEDGTLLCLLANYIQDMAEKYSQRTGKPVPGKKVTFHKSRRGIRESKLFHSRDNVEKFLSWCRQHGIPEAILFESNDVVLVDECRTGGREIVICLMEIARRCSSYELQQLPKLIQLEREIEEEEFCQAATTACEPLTLDTGGSNDIQGDRSPIDSDSGVESVFDEGVDPTVPQLMEFTLDDSHEHIENYVAGTTNTLEDQKPTKQQKELSSLLESKGPKTELDKKVCKIAQDYNIKIVHRLKEGKYIILGKTMFVRMLNDHLLVRIGGGWDTLEHYIMTHTPKPTTGENPISPPSQQPDNHRKKSGVWSKLVEKVKRRESQPNITASPVVISKKPRPDSSPVSYKLRDRFTKRLSVEEKDGKDISEAIQRIESSILLTPKDSPSFTSKTFFQLKNRFDRGRNSSESFSKKKSKEMDEGITHINGGHGHENNQMNSNDLIRFNDEETMSAFCGPQGSGDESQLIPEVVSLQAEQSDSKNPSDGGVVVYDENDAKCIGMMSVEDIPKQNQVENRSEESGETSAFESCLVKDDSNHEQLKTDNLHEISTLSSNTEMHQQTFSFEQTENILVEDEQEATSKQPEQEAEPKQAEQEAQPQQAEQEAEPQQAGQEAEPQQAEQEAEPQQAEQEAEPQQAEQEAQPQQAEQEAEPQQAEPKQAEQEAEPKQAEQEAQPQQAEQEAEPQQAEQEAEPKQAEQEAEPQQAEQEAQAQQAGQEAEPQQAVQEAEPEQAEKEAQPQQAEQEVEPPQQAEKEVEPQQAEQQAEPEQAEQEAEPQQTEQEAEPQQAEQEAEPKQAEQEAEPQQVEQEAEPQQAEQEAEPQQAEQEAEPQQAEQEAEPQQDEQEAQPQQAEQEAEPQQAEQEAQPQQAEQEAQPQQAEQEAQPQQAEQEAQPQQAEQEAEPQQAEQEAEPQQAEQEAESQQAEKEADSRQTKQEAESQQAEKEVECHKAEQEAEPKQAEKEAKTKVGVEHKFNKVENGSASKSGNGTEPLKQTCKKTLPKQNVAGRSVSSAKTTTQNRASSLSTKAKTTHRPTSSTAAKSAPIRSTRPQKIDVGERDSSKSEGAVKSATSPTKHHITATKATGASSKTMKVTKTSNGTSTTTTSNARPTSSSKSVRDTAKPPGRVDNKKPFTTSSRTSTGRAATTSVKSNGTTSKPTTAGINPSTTKDKKMTRPLSAPLSKAAPNTTTKSQSARPSTARQPEKAGGKAPSVVKSSRDSVSKPSSKTTARPTVKQTTAPLNGKARPASALSTKQKPPTGSTRPKRESKGNAKNPVSLKDVKPVPKAETSADSENVEKSCDPQSKVSNIESGVGNNVGEKSETVT